MTEALQEWIQSLGPWGLSVLFGSALIEYVFPPFPGDTITVFGAWLAVSGTFAWPWVWLAVTGGSGAGMVADWYFGRWLGSKSDKLPSDADRPWWNPLSAQRVARFEVHYRKWGVPLILANRFLPAVRAFLFVAAGASGIPLRRVLALGLVSAGAWNGLLLGAGYAVGANLEELEQSARRFGVYGWVALGGLALLIAVVALVRRSKRQRPRSS